MIHSLEHREKGCDGVENNVQSYAVFVYLFMNGEKPIIAKGMTFWSFSAKTAVFASCYSTQPQRPHYVQRRDCILLTDRATGSKKTDIIMHN